MNACCLRDSPLGVDVVAILFCGQKMETSLRLHTVLVGGTVKQEPGRLMHGAIVTHVWILSIPMKLTLIYLILTMNF